KVPVRDRPDMRDLGHSRLHAFDKIKRAIDLAQRPRCERKIGPRPNARVMPETKGEIAVALGIEPCERSFEMTARPGIVSLDPVGDAADAVRNAGFRRIGLTLDFAQKRRGLRPHRTQLASQTA